MNSLASLLEEKAQNHTEFTQLPHCSLSLGARRCAPLREEKGRSHDANVERSAGDLCDIVWASPHEQARSGNFEREENK